MARKPIAVVPITAADEDTATAPTIGFALICDDGAFFQYYFRDSVWTRYPGVPGTPGEDRNEE